jgi:hypothetical protein
MIPRPNQIAAPSAADTMINSQIGQLNVQNRNVTVTSSVFWKMNAINAATPEPLAIAPALTAVPLDSSARLLALVGSMVTTSSNR